VFVWRSEKYVRAKVGTEFFQNTSHETLLLEVFALLVCYAALIGSTLEDATDTLSKNVSNYQSTLHNITEEQIPYLYHSRSQKSRTTTRVSFA
jgi:hypothetical protein